MSTLEMLRNTDKQILNFIKEGKNITDFALKKKYQSMQVEKSLPDFYEVIDNLIYEGRIYRVYEPDSQVPFYKVREN